MLSGYSLLVTGAAGFLGRAVVTQLRAFGARVVGTTHTLPSDSALVQVDLQDQGSLVTLSSWGPFDAVIHFAAVLPGRCGDLETLVTNQRMTHNLATWSVEQKVERFLYASSCAVYGQQSEPCSEASIPQPDNAYAVSKLACEYLLKVVLAQTKTELCVLRISAPYGPNMVTETVVTRFLKRVGQGSPLELLGSGRRSQDFVYQDDVARACARALWHRATGVFNISGDQSVSMRELAEAVLRIFGKPASGNILSVGKDPQETYRGRFPVQAAKDSFGYRPEVNLEEGLRRTAQALRIL